MRIPCDLAAHPSTGLDVGKLAAAGVDMFNLSGWYHTTQQNDVAAVRKLVPEAAIYLEMTHSAGSLYFACGKSAYGTASFPRTSDIQFYTTAHKAYEDGADGDRLFNFVYFRDHGTAKCAVINEPPFHVLDHIADRAWLAKQPQHYWLGRWVFKSAFADPNVRTLAADNPTTITLNLAPPRKPRSESARLRIHTKDPIPEGCDITIELNGTALDTSNDLSPLYGNPYDGMISDTPRRRSWTFPASNAREGVNDIVIRADAEKPMELTWLELAIE